MKTDSLFYRLFQEHPEVVFELAEWPLPAEAGYTLQAEEVKQTGFRLEATNLRRDNPTLGAPASPPASGHSTPVNSRQNAGATRESP